MNESILRLPYRLPYDWQAILAFLSRDVALQRALAEQSQRPTPRELLARAEAWRPWRAYAVLHLWHADAATMAAKPEQEKGDATLA